MYIQTLLRVSQFKQDHKSTFLQSKMTLNVTKCRETNKKNEMNSKYSINTVLG